MVLSGADNTGRVGITLALPGVSSSAELVIEETCICFLTCTTGGVNKFLRLEAR